MANDKNELVLQNDFAEVLAIIQNAQKRAYVAVNNEHMNMCWMIGEYVHNKVKAGSWGDRTVNQLSEFLKTKLPSRDGFSPQNLRRMKQIYEIYRNDELCSPLVSKLDWTKNIMIMSLDSKEERAFYLKLATQNRYSKRELERQIGSSLYERSMLSKTFNPKELIANPKHRGLTTLRDSYVLEFMDLPKDHSEKDLRKQMVANLKDFILELGKDFAFVGEEYRVQVGNEDYFIDLVFFNRREQCLIAIELKTEKFKPAHLGQLQFYLEALDRDVRMEHERLSAGLLICAKKDDAVVEYAMSKSLAPSVVANYKLALPDKKLLEQRVEELIELNERQALNN